MFFVQVQGVFFRRYTVKEAQALSLVGWVRNTDQGTVEGEAQGRPDKLAELKVRACITAQNSSCTRSVLF